MADDERVGVGVGMRDIGHRHVAAATALVLDVHLLAERFRHLGGEAARDDAARAAGREGHDETNGLGRIILRRGGAGDGECERKQDASHRYKPCCSSQRWMSAATSRLFLSIISMCELPRMPAFGRSTTSTLPPAARMASPNATPFLRIVGQRLSVSMPSP